MLLKHRANLGEEIEEVTFALGDEIDIRKEWSDRYLGKDGEGQMFNFPKDAVEP